MSSVASDGRGGLAPASDGTGGGPPAVEAAGLERRYHDGERVIEVLRGLSLSVGRGESVAVIGESGVGKSTLLHLLGGLDKPDGGVVRVGGADLYALPARQLAAVRGRSIGFVFQFHHLLGDFDATENVMMPLLVAGHPPGRARARANELLDRVGLRDRRSHRPSEMSGGEQQRVAVARALALRPSVVLADEPTGNLDPATADEVHGLLMDVQREEGAALVVATHNIALAGMLGRTLRMQDGVLKEVERS
ncbi:MAG TPA: ABC transporter ATP-binding protein [Candidatus Limnocylindrales bacterium]|nr:ABC transporter ATP-binding protein [Candidatus Limnocylindrales bacterium]